MRPEPESGSKLTERERERGGKKKGGGGVVDKEDRGREKQRESTHSPFNSMIGYQHAEKKTLYLSTNKIKVNACEASLSFTQLFLCFSIFFPALNRKRLLFKNQLQQQ